MVGPDMKRAIVSMLVLAVASPAYAVPVTFTVDVPACTPRASTVMLRSNRLDAATYVHDALTRIGPTRWEGTFEVAVDASAFRYKYTHAICDATVCPGIEKALTYAGSGADVADRTLVAGATHATDLVYIWRSALVRLDAAGNVVGARPPSDQVAFCAPYLSVSTADGAVTVSYDAYDAGDVALELGETTAYGTRIAHTGAYRNRFALADLVPGTEYHYRIVDNGVATPDQTFRAPPAPGQPMRFAFIGDTQYYGEAQRNDFARVAEQVLAFRPDLVLSPGDMVASEPGPGGPGGWTEPEMGRWNVFFGGAAALMGSAPWMAAMGNHEEDGFFFWDAFSFPEPDAPRVDHYFFRVGNVHFTVLYTGSTSGYDFEGILGSQTAWMEGVLAAADADAGVRFKVVLLHRGPLSEGDSHPTDGMAFWETGTALRPSWRELWERYGVDLVLAGHNHNFTLAEVGGVRYVTSCGGAPLHDQRSPWAPTTIYAERVCTADLFSVSERTISFSAQRVDGSVIDDAAFTLCHDASDCEGTASGCAAVSHWSCVRRACEPTCAMPGLDAAVDVDGGAVDASATPDATVPRDAPTGADGGSTAPASAGCSCRIARASFRADGRALVLLPLAGLAFAARVRSRTRARRSRPGA